ncbi:hypothetical protein HMPREF9064_1540 [Aggregatibacter segnis ATCC 33393]|uniref:Uncharacterized protein n=1 Tax=Aggregatibacter segnis ATCC 33393 TaxID=888057 RepID=E6KZJ8_9PAST|nr:hypothetical protein HMPREF9064_1540 [Aggregatibacter segnis ATCC 33393]
MLAFNPLSFHSQQKVRWIFTALFLFLFLFFIFYLLKSYFST